MTPDQSTHTGADSRDIASPEAGKFSTGQPASLLDRLRVAADVRLLVLALVLFTFVFRIRLPPAITDDAYITFRYAENLARGAGFVFNEGERVLGTTTPLFAIVLAAVKFGTSISPETPALWLAALSDAATVYLLFRLSMRGYGEPRPGILAGLLYALSPLAVRFSINGMETSLAVALILGGLLLYLEDRLRAAALATAVAILVRPEAGLMAVLITVDLYGSERKRQAAAFSGSVLALIAPWIIFAALYFGSPIPHSIAAKSTSLYQWSIVQTASVFLSHFAFLFIGYPLGGMVGVQWPGAVQNLGPLSVWIFSLGLALLQALLIVGGARQWLKNDRRAWVVAAFPILYLILYLGSAMMNVFIFDWYLAPLQPFYLLYMAAGLLAIARGPLSGASTKAAYTIMVLSLLAGYRWDGEGIGSPLSAESEREDEYREVAIRFRDSFGPESVVAASEIGALGYYSDARILDTAGLISPSALRYYPLPASLYSTNYAIPPDLIRDSQPDFLVTFELFASGGLLKEEWFAEDYEEIYRKSTQAFNDSDLLVYQKAIPGHNE